MLSLQILFSEHRRPGIESAMQMPSNACWIPARESEHSSGTASYPASPDNRGNKTEIPLSCLVRAPLTHCIRGPDFIATPAVARVG